jgi:hypothetical protein
LSINEEIIGNYTGMVGYLSERPPIISLKNGTTVLTSKRIIFLRSRLGETRYENMDKVEKDLQNKDSFYIKRENIVGVFADTRVRVPYLIIEYQNNNETQIASFAALDYNAIINLVLLFRRELQEKDPSYSEDKRQRDLILIDQSHDQPDIALQALHGMIRAAALDQRCADPMFFTDSRYVLEEKRKSWNTDKDLLDKTAMLISIGTQHDKFNQNDSAILKNYVQSGGTLFLTAIPRKKPPNKLVGEFGISFGEEGIRDRKNHGVFQDHIIVKNFQEHPANNEIESIMFGDHGCYPIYFTQDTGIPIAISSKDSKPSNSIVAAEVPFGDGRVIVVGQCRIFMDDYIGEENNSDWLYNLLEYGLNQDKQAPHAAPSPETIIEEPPIKQNFCSNCGHKLGEGHKFCSNCGTSTHHLM